MSETRTHEETNITDPFKRPVSLKEFILLGKDYALEVLKNWKLLILFIIPPAIWMCYKAINTKPTYSAKLTFMVNEDDTKRSSISGILNDFGLGFGSSTEYNLDKILDLSQSMLIVREVLFEKGVVNDQEDFLANHFIRELEYQRQWKRKMPVLSDFFFQTDSFPVFDRKDRKVLKVLHRDIIGNQSMGISGLFKSTYSETSGILSLSISTPSEELSLHFIHLLFDKLSAYYIQSSIEKQKETFDNIQEKVDSIKAVLSSKEVQLARFEDSNQRILGRQNSLKRDRLYRDIQLLSLMYAEAVKNQETAGFTLKNKTPFIKPIDLPFSPLGKSQPSWMISLFKGILLGIALGVAFILGRRIFREIMA